MMAQRVNITDRKQAVSPEVPHGPVAGMARVKRIIEYEHSELFYGGTFLMRCYELEDGTLLRVDTMEPWAPSPEHTFVGELPGQS